MGENRNGDGASGRMGERIFFFTDSTIADSPVRPVAVSCFKFADSPNRCSSLQRDALLPRDVSEDDHGIVQPLELHVPHPERGLVR